MLVEAIALGQMLAEDAGGPLAKAYAPMGFDPVAHGNDHIQVVMLDGALDLSLALLANYPEIPDSSSLSNSPSS